MQVYTLQAGDEVVLDGDTRLTVLAIEGEDVLLGVSAPATARVLAPDVPELQALCWAARNTAPGNN
jgi:sRNA-binding carbon storage regulator CsrA